MTKLIIECDDEIAQRWEACLNHYNELIRLANSMGANVSMNISRADSLLLMGIEGYEEAIDKIKESQ